MTEQVRKELVQLTSGKAIIEMGDVVASI